MEGARAREGLNLKFHWLHGKSALVNEGFCLNTLGFLSPALTRMQQTLCFEK